MCKLNGIVWYILLLGPGFSYSIEESLFPNGHYALPMSADGCPEDSSRGWHVGYINLTTTIPFNQADAYLSSCGGMFKHTSTSAYSMKPFSMINILGNFDDYTLQWNFCFKSHDNSVNSSTRWPDKIFGVYGAEEGCPNGFSTHYMSSCLPKVLFYNQDGHLPYFVVEEHQHNTVFTYRYCRRAPYMEEQTTEAFQSFYPLYVIKDPQAEKCPLVRGCVVIEEYYPGPIHTVMLDSNVSFILSYCFIVSNRFQLSLIDRTSGNSTDIFDSTGTPFVDSQVFYPAVGEYISGSPTLVEIWLLIDTRKTRLVSGIAFQTFRFRGEDTILHQYNGKQANVSQIFVGDERWSFRHGGALRCRFAAYTAVQDWYFFLSTDMNAYSCYRSQYGRYVTMILTATDVLGDSRMYNITSISVLMRDNENDRDISRCNEELGMRDYEIGDHQLSASTWQHSNPPSASRPYHSGWCAMRQDEHPYFQIDLLTATLVDGIALRYRYSVDDTVLCYMSPESTKTTDSYFFSVEFGLTPDQMKRYSEKAFMYDVTQSLETRQTYLFTEAVTARFIRIYLAPLNGTAPCMTFELLGCRKPYDSNKTEYLTRIKENLALAFEVPYTPINQEQLLSSFGYPKNYDYNTFYKWNISFPGAFVDLQFEDISLRSYEDNGFLNNINCRDYIIVSEFEINNPLMFVTDNYLRTSDLPPRAVLDEPFYIRMFMTSADNGRRPDVRSTVSEGFPLYLAFLSCSTGNLLQTGRGFRAHVVKTERPVCMTTDDTYARCGLEAMEVVSPEFLGWKITRDAYSYLLTFSKDFLLVRVTVVDFELNCNADSYLLLGGTRYCNENIFEEQMFSAIDVYYYKYTLPQCEDQLFPEGFHLEYKALARNDIVHDYVLISEENITIHDVYEQKREVCSKKLKKCYSLEISQTSWEDGTLLCRKKNMLMVSIKSKMEHNYLSTLLLDIYYSNRPYFFGVHYYDFDPMGVASIPIGLFRFQDSSGLHHEHWVDGTPLTFTAWNENQPSDTILKQCSRMIFDPTNVEKENTWETETCKSDLNETARFLVCERRLEEISEHPKAYIQDCYETKASEYIGNVSVTRYGQTCQRWTHRTPNKHDFTSRKYFPDKTLRDASNYCRSPDGDNTPWCFTMDVMVAWDYCAIPKCSSGDIVSLSKDRVTLFLCESGEWMPHTVKCNNISECLDGSDEQNCLSSGEGCLGDEFTCTDGRCIHMFQVCNFITDCNDASDEFCEFRACDGGTEFKCDNGQCIPAKQRCDSYRQCKDSSDEQLCEQCNSDEAFQCADRTCISKRLVCDLHFDCIDRSDEVSCDHVYETCDEVWLNGLVEDGTYLTGAPGYRTKCTFNKTSGFLQMVYLNKDWTRKGTDTYHIHTPDMGLISTYSRTHGYACSRQYEKLPNRQEQRVIMLNNNLQEFRGEFYSYWGYSTTTYGGPGYVLPIRVDFNVSETRIKMHNIICLKGLAHWDSTTFCKKGMKAEKQKRWCTRGIEGYFYVDNCAYSAGCGLNRWNENIFCSKGKTVERESMCLYSRDINGIVEKCRNLNHLQNCENVPCPQHYFKCPNSYCVPVMYVCNGEIDCPDGDDEKECGCRQTNIRRMVILVPSSDIISVDRSIWLYETALRFGGTLFTEQSRVRVIRVRQSNKNLISLESTDIIANSEYPNRLFDTYSLSDGDETWKVVFGANNSAEGITMALLWVTDKPDYTDAESNIFSSLEKTNFSRNIFKYRIITDSNVLKDFSVSRQQDITEVNIRDKGLLRTLGITLFSDICKGQPVVCKGAYRCSLSIVCIPFVQVCDGKSHCPYGDDEEECDFTCPRDCACRALIVSCANVHSEFENETVTIPDTTRVLDASNTTYIGASILSFSGQNVFHYMISLNISRCGISLINTNSFLNLKNLLTLDISFNDITSLSRDTFIHLKFLQVLHMLGNRFLYDIEPGAFNSLQIKSLVINGAKLEHMFPDTFSGLNLETLDLSGNQIKSVDDMTFNGLTTKDIHINDNPIIDFSKHMFDGVFGVEKLQTPAYKFCCVRPAYLEEVDCGPHRDEFSSCKHLMRNTALQALVWVIGLMALIGNILSIIYRLIYDRERLKLGYGMFVTNLAISDFLMGVYMLIIAVADRIFIDRYIEVDEYWRKSAWCQLAGILSTVSSEASVLFMCFITIDRILVIKFPFGQHRFNNTSIWTSVFLTWTLALLIAVFPIFFESYFQGKFYNKSGVCLALPLTRDRPPGWLYAILIFVGFNLITFTLIAAGQMLIYGEIRKQARTQKRMNVTRTNDLKVARNLLLLVATDFLCWFPVGLMGILAMAGHVIPGEMYAWTAVLILPINSALNPFMYTFAAIIGKGTFAPSMTEQANIEAHTEKAKAMLTILPYVAMGTGSNNYNNKICTLESLMKIRPLTVDELLQIIYTVTRYIDMLHDNSMVINEICEKHVMVKVSADLEKIKAVKIVKIPSLSIQKRGQTTDIQNIGVLLDTLIQALN